MPSEKKQIINVDFSGVDRRIRDIISMVGKEADKRNLSAYVVGGWVRDILLKRENLDLDIVVVGNAVLLAKFLAKKRRAAIKIYKNFRTATVTLEDGFEVDFAMARQEKYLRSGALPKVSAGSMKDDLYRRDFTINAMALSINQKDFGNLLDSYGGLSDLRKGRVRILHKKSFFDDPTRILRAIRFERRFGFSMNRKTLRLLKEALEKNAVNSVKAPRYFNEFRKILKEPFPYRCIRRLKKLNAFEFLGKHYKPHMRLLGRIERRIEKIKKKNFFYSNLDWSRVYLIALLGYKNKIPIDKLASSLHLTRQERTILKESQRCNNIIKRLKRRKLKPSQVYLLLRSLDVEVAYFMRANTSSLMAALRVDHYLMKSRFVKLDISGDEIKRFGISSGKRIGKAMDILLLKKIDGVIKNYRQERKELKKLNL